MLMNTTPSSLPVKAHRPMLTQVYQAIRLHFAHWQDAAIGPEQLDEAFDTLKREALTCANREQFSLLLMAFLAQLNNGHTRWRDPAFEAHPPLGMRLRPREGRWVVIASDIAALRAGDIILNIAGKSIETWYSDLQRYLTGSPQSRTVQFGDALQGQPQSHPDRRTLRRLHRPTLLSYLRKWTTILHRCPTGENA